jgi:tripartite-type tricarboxylate transporter receptor subunit TctC
MQFVTFRRWLLALTICIAHVMGPSAEAAYPEKTIRLVVPYAPGGGNDVLARILAPKLAEFLGQPVIVENRPGASGSVGSAEVARAAPDGYTILIATNAMVINPAVYTNLGFDILKDFAPLGLIADVQFVLVAHPSVAAKSIDELIGLAKRSPGTLNHSTAGNGSPQHLAAELFNEMAGVSLTHIPYKGTGPAIADVVGGQVQLCFATLPPVTQHIASGRLRALAMTGAKRSPLLPELPTLDELGVKGYEASSWYGLLVPAKTPAAVQQVLSNAVSRTIQDKDIQAKLLAQGFEPGFRESAAMAQVMRSDLVKWDRVVKRAKIKAD